MTLSKSEFSINIQTNGLNIKLLRQLCNFIILEGFQLDDAFWWQSPLNSTAVFATDIIHHRHHLRRHRG